MNKSNMIELLTDDDFDSVRQTYNIDWLYRILTEGFKGYRNMTTKELTQEIKARGL